MQGRRALGTISALAVVEAAVVVVMVVLLLLLSSPIMRSSHLFLTGREGRTVLTTLEFIRSGKEK